MKFDEIYFLFLIADKDSSQSVRDIINSDSCNIHHKRCWYLLNKWVNKGFYEYGVTLDLGWLTDKGVKFVEELRGKENKV